MQSEYSNDLRVKIPEIIDKRSEIYYKIEASYEKRKKWTIDRSFKQFCDLHNKIYKKIPNMPILPEKSFFQLTYKDLQKRRMELEKYLNALCFKKDVLVDPSFREFLEFDKYSKEEELARYLTEIENTGMEVSQMIYLPYSGALMLGLGESGLTAKLDNIMSMLAAPVKTTSQVQGTVACYLEEPIGSLQFTKLWNHIVDSNILCMYWEEDLTLLAVGLESGNISVVTISSERQYEQFDEYCTVKQHASAVTGVALIKSTAMLVSISLDKNLIITRLIESETEDRSYQKLHMHPLVKMTYDPQKERLFIADSIGTLFIYAAEAPLVLLGVVDFPRQNYVTSFFWEPNPGYLFAGSKQGVIAIYEIEKPGREKFTQIVGSIETIKDISDMCFISSSRQLLVSNDGGNVLFVNSQNAASFYTLDAHVKDITALNYIPDLRLLITASKDKSIKFWRYPFDPEKDTGSLLHQSTIMRAQKAIKKSRGIYASDYDYKQAANSKPYYSNTNVENEDESVDYYSGYKQTKKDHEGYTNTSKSSTNTNYDYFKRYDSFKNSDKDDEEEEAKPPANTFKKNKNLSIHDDSKITQREEDDEHDHYELGSSRKNASKPAPVKEVHRREEQDSEDEIGLPKNPFAKNALPIPFTQRIDPEEKSDLRGWEAGVREEDEEVDPEKLKKAKRPLVSHFREFPTKAKTPDYQAYVAKFSTKDDDDDEKHRDLGGWESTQDKKAKLNSNTVGAKNGKSEVKPQFAGKFTTSEFIKSTMPEKKTVQIHRDFEEDELSGWAR